MNKILIVDDTTSWIVFHKSLIQELYGDFFDITTAKSAMEAIDIIRRNDKIPFDVIITDLQMEDAFDGQLAGEWLTEQIKLLNFCSRTKIIMISAVYNIEMIAKRQNVECISKNMLLNNKLLMKFMFEKLMPSLNNLK